MSSRLAPRPASPVQMIRFSAARKPLRALVPLGAIGHGTCIGDEQRTLHSGAVEHAGAEQFGEAAAAALLHDIRQETEILIT